MIACDTNVLVSAFIADGPPSRVLEHVVAGSLRMALLEAAAVELFAALTLKLGVDETDAREHLAILRELAETVQPSPHSQPEATSGDPADDVILASAHEAQVGLLITGDRRHLLPLGTHQGVRILSPQAFLAEIHRAP